MQFKVYTRIRRIKSLWESIIPNDDKRVYQSYRFNKLCEKYRKTSISGLKEKNTKCLYVVGFVDNKAVCIAPLCVDESPEKTIHVLGHGTNAGYLDFIYNEPVFVKDVLNYVERTYSDYSIDFTFIKESSPLISLLKTCEHFSNYCICIKTYDIWFARLSKNTRQNIRTAYNRLQSDKHIFELCKYNRKSHHISFILSQCNNVYQRRKLDWQGIGGNVNKKNSLIFLLRDVIYRGLMKFQESELVVLKIDEDIAGFFIGFKFQHGVYIPRLAIDTRYSRYSPGIIMINEYLKDISIEGLFYFDLCRGDESYKSKLGGECSSSFRLTKIVK